MIRKAAFLDRDGVINNLISRDGGWFSPQSLEDFSLRDGVQDFVSYLKRRSYVVIVVTNQPDVSRGLLASETLSGMHKVLTREIDPLDIFVCPHDQHEGCKCRKPRPGMILEAALKHQLDLSSSILVGDRLSDIQAASSAKVQPFLLVSPQTESAPVPNLVRCHSFAEISHHLDNFPK